MLKTARSENRKVEHARSENKKLEHAKLRKECRLREQ
jgi:hypothetical protein